MLSRRVRLYAYHKRMGICDVKLDIVCGRSALDQGWKLGVVQIDFSAASGSVSHFGLLYKYRDV